MKIEKYIKLNQDEIDLIKKSVSEFLKPINPEVEIDEKPSVIHCWHEANNDREEYDLYSYDITISSSKGKYESFFEVGVNVDLSEIGWSQSYHYFQEFDKDYFSEIGKNLWDKKDEIIERLKNDSLA